MQVVVGAEIAIGLDETLVVAVVAVCARPWRGDGVAASAPNPVIKNANINRIFFIKDSPYYLYNFITKKGVHQEEKLKNKVLVVIRLRYATPRLRPPKSALVVSDW